MQKMPQAFACGIWRFYLLPVEADQTHDVNNDHSHGNHIAENGLHPVLDFQALAGVGFCQEVLPAPAIALVAAENDKDQRAQRQQVVGDDEIPQIQPCGAFREGLEGPQAVAQRSGHRGGSDDNAADQAALGSVPAEQLTGTGQNVFKHSQHSGHGRKDHEQEEDAAPHFAAVHVVEDGGHGVKQQAGALAHFQIIGKAGGEDNQARSNRHECIQDDNIDGFAHEGAVLIQVAAENSHGADTQAQGEESLVHSAHDHIGGDFAKVGHQVEGQAFLGAAHGCTVHSQHDHQAQQRHHHILGDPLQAALQVEAQNGKADGHNNQHKGYIHTGVGDHTHKAQVSGAAGDKAVEVVQNPAGDNGVEAHEADVAKQRQIAMDMPLLAGLLQLLIHLNGRCLRSTAQGELHGHNRQTQQNQAQHINQHKAAAAILTGHPGEFPHIAAADGAACTEQDESQAGSQTFAIFHNFIFLSYSISE